MRNKVVTIIYNAPETGYQELCEHQAELGVLDEAQAVEQALKESGLPVNRLALHPPLSIVEKTLKELQTDIVFNLFEGFAGHPETEAVIATLLEKTGS